MKLAPPPSSYDAGDQARMRSDLERADQGNLKKGAAVTEILISKPDGTVGRLTVNSGGTVIWTAL